MKGLILYGSFHGTTEYFSKYISEKTGIEYSKIDDFDSNKIDNYDYFVIGSAVQRFNFHPAVVNFFNDNVEKLKGKRIFLFISCYNPVILNDLIEKLDDEIKSKLDVSMVLGGKIEWKKLTFIEKILISIINIRFKVNLKNFDTVNTKRIDKFIDKLNKRI